MPVQFAGAHIVILPMIIYIFANASGAHFNPIITASFVASGRMVTTPSISPCRAPCMLIGVMSSVEGQAQRSGHVSVHNVSEGAMHSCLSAETEDQTQLGHS